jgi:hypothetical protein
MEARSEKCRLQFVEEMKESVMVKVEPSEMLPVVISLTTGRNA